MKLQIVVHCWLYHRLFTYQLSSLVLNPPSEEVKFTVFYSLEDKNTCSTLDYFKLILPKNVVLDLRPKEKEQLFRRGIGRQEIALSTQADWVFYTDADILFLEGCLDSMIKETQKCKEDLAYPKELIACKTHALGDFHMSRVTHPEIYRIPKIQFQREKVPRAIGGVQLVRGSKLRDLGYCEEKYLQSASEWQNTKEDISLRRLIGSKGVPLDIINCYRLRHTRSWRDKLMESL